jgi:hypothetical protein
MTYERHANDVKQLTHIDIGRTCFAQCLVSTPQWSYFQCPEAAVSDSFCCAHPLHFFDLPLAGPRLGKTRELAQIMRFLMSTLRLAIAFFLQVLIFLLKINNLNVETRCRILFASSQFFDLPLAGPVGARMRVHVAFFRQLLMAHHKWTMVFHPA